MTRPLRSTAIQPQSHTMTVNPKAMEAAENAYASATVDLPHHDCDRCGGSGTIITIAAELGAGGDVCPVCGGGGVIVDFPDDWNPMVNAIRAYLAALPQGAAAAGVRPEAFTLDQLAKLTFAIYYSTALCAPQNIAAEIEAIDCGPGCEHTSASGSICYRFERGEHCPNQLAETLREISAALYGTPGLGSYREQVWGPGAEKSFLPATLSPDPTGALLKQAEADVISERRRQVEGEGWTPEHDDEHRNGELAAAAACYALGARPDRGPWRQTGTMREGVRNYGGNYWPWSAEWWKPRDPRRNLVKAGALILAEIERLDRAASNTKRGEVAAAQSPADDEGNSD